MNSMASSLMVFETMYLFLRLGGHSVLLLMLDLSAAFKLVKHQILTNRLSSIANAASQSLKWGVTFLQDGSVVT